MFKKNSLLVGKTQNNFYYYFFFIVVVIIMRSKENKKKRRNPYKPSLSKRNHGSWYASNNFK